MHKFLYIFIAVLFLASCGHNKKYFKYDIEDVNIDSVPCTDIYGELLPINVSGTNSLFIADSLLLVDKQDGSSRYFLTSIILSHLIQLQVLDYVAEQKMNF